MCYPYEPLWDPKQTSCGCYQPGWVLRVISCAHPVPCRALQVTHALQQLTGDVTLSIPDVSFETPETGAADSELVNALEQCMAEWSQVGVMHLGGGGCWRWQAVLDHAEVQVT
jgi:hypothetical protein